MHQDQHSSVTGGIISIILGIFFAAYSVIIIMDVTKDNYTLSEEYRPLSTIGDFKLGDYMKTMGIFSIEYPSKVNSTTSKL